MRELFLRAALLLCMQAAFAQPGLEYYLPDENYLPGIPTPESVTGHAVGEWHLTHDKLTAYLSELAAVSDRVILEEYARSWEIIKPPWRK